MGNRQSSTQNQQFSQANTFGWETPPDTADVQALRSHQFQVDPTIGHRVGGAIRRMQDSFQSPLGGYTTPQMRDAIQRTQERELLQEGGAQFRAGQYDVNNQQFGQKAAVAGMTAPRMVQKTSSGTSSGKATTSEPWYNGLVQGGASMGSALLL